MKGIDVSRHQGDINWQKVKDSGIEFAMLRAGYGKIASQEDSRFKANYSGCTAVGIPCGVYWYSYALTPDDAVKEAEACLAVIKGKKLDFPVYFDIEEMSQFALGPDKCTAIAEAFCRKIEGAGYWAGIYSYKYFLQSRLILEIRKRFAVWVAHTGVHSTNYGPQFGIWQYSHNGSVPGIDGRVDCDYCYIDYPRLIAEKRLNGSEIMPHTRVYTVKKGDSLWKIAKMYFGTGTRWREIMEFNGLRNETIFPGQKLRIP